MLTSAGRNCHSTSITSSGNLEFSRSYRWRKNRFMPWIRTPGEVSSDVPNRLRVTYGEETSQVSRVRGAIIETHAFFSKVDNTRRPVKTCRIVVSKMHSEYEPLWRLAIRKDHLTIESVIIEPDVWSPSSSLTAFCLSNHLSNRVRPAEDSVSLRKVVFPTSRDPGGANLVSSSPQA
jgi:hypothetical protein